MRYRLLFENCVSTLIDRNLYLVYFSYLWHKYKLLYSIYAQLFLLFNDAYKCLCKFSIPLLCIWIMVLQSNYTKGGILFILLCCLQALCRLIEIVTMGCTSVEIKTKSNGITKGILGESPTGTFFLWSWHFQVYFFHFHLSLSYQK